MRTNGRVVWIRAMYSSGELASGVSPRSKAIEAVSQAAGGSEWKEKPTKRPFILMGNSGNTRMIANGAQKNPHVTPSSLRIISNSQLAPKTRGPLMPSGGFVRHPSIQYPPLARAFVVVMGIRYTPKCVPLEANGDSEIAGRTLSQSCRDFRVRLREGSALH